jgi:GAF domain-containing protein
MRDVIENEDRLATLRNYDVMDTPAEPQFDEIVREAAEALGTSMSTVTLVDERRQWFKARVGVPHQETSIADSICAHVVAGGETLVLPDAAADRRFDDNSKVGGEGGVRFYAGVPLTLRDGSRVGTLCVLDESPREGVSDEDMRTLERLARRTVAAFEASRDIREAIGIDPIKAGDAVWIAQATAWLEQAAAALDRIGARVPAAHLDQVIAMVEAMRDEPRVELVKAA